MMDFLSDDARRDPFPMYERLRAAAPVAHVPGFDIWLALGFEAVKRVLTDADAFSSNVGPTRGLTFEWLMFLDPPRHTQLRAIVARAFTPRSVADLEPRVRELSRGLLDAALPPGELDVARDFAVPLPILVIAELLGVPRADVPRMHRWSEATIGLANTIMGTPDESRAASEAFLACNAEMADYFAALGAARRAAPRDDLLTRLIHAEVEGVRLNELEILRFVQLLVAAGTETTTNLIDNAMLCFAEHPAQYARVRAEPALLPSAIEEVLRYRSPAQAMLRATRRAVELDGVQIPAGKMVLAMLGAANRDPAHFDDPTAFDIARAPNTHVAFGHGIHFCIGAPLSRLEARVALGELIPRIGEFQLASDEPWQPRRAFNVHGPTSLPIRFKGV